MGLRVHGEFPPEFKGEKNREIFHKKNSFTPVPHEMKCQICNKMFPDRSRGEVPSYKQHYLTVHGVVPPEFKGRKQYLCSQCPEVFFKQDVLNKHMITKHNLMRMIQCEHCNL